MTASLELLRRLVGFDTVSHKSNLELIDFVRGYLFDLGVDSTLIHDDGGAKANLYATLGANDRPGLLLAGHTDVVPVDDQDWSSDPFTLTERDDKLFGRGACDMKGFIAAALALAPEFVERSEGPPVHFAFTFDEEVGCFGAQSLVEHFAHLPVRPKACVVGEPTSMRVINGHKGKVSYRCEVLGLEGHSAYTDKAVNAVEAAAELVARLRAMARRLKSDGPFDTSFDPPYTTVHTGTIEGGTALNIVPRSCAFDFEIRTLPGQDPEHLIKELKEFAEQTLAPEMHAVSPATGFSWVKSSAIPALAPIADCDIADRAMALTGDNAPGHISFATEAGLYQEAAIPTIVCGPGDIKDAHRPDEFVTRDQITACEDFLRAIVGIEFSP
ncbi:MAG: acetylornithine deacetylase [Alphaproteobacteria bacterium]